MASLSPPTAPAAVRGTSALELKGLTAAYGRTVVLSRASLSIPTGSLAALVGPPEAGKSTVLRCALGLLRPRAGDVCVLGQAPRLSRHQVGYLPQNGLVDWRFPVSTLEVVLMGRFAGLGLTRRPSGQDRARATACLAEVGLAHLAPRPVADLDRRQRCLVLLARAIARDPALLLLDEPLQDLGPPTEQELFGLLDRLRRGGRTLVVATRALTSLAEHFEHVVLLNGRVVAEGPPAAVLTRANLDATYGSRAVTLMVGAGYFAVDAGPEQR